jgi:hypothetical protein
MTDLYNERRRIVAQRLCTCGLLLRFAEHGRIPLQDFDQASVGADIRRLISRATRLSRGGLYVCIHMYNGHMKDLGPSTADMAGSCIVERTTSLRAFRPLCARGLSPVVTC